MSKARTFWICPDIKCSFKGTLKQGELCPKCRKPAEAFDPWSMREIHLKKMEHKGIHKFWLTNKFKQAKSEIPIPSKYTPPLKPAPTKRRIELYVAIGVIIIALAIILTLLYAGFFNPKV